MHYPTASSTSTYATDYDWCWLSYPGDYHIVGCRFARITAVESSFWFLCPLSFGWSVCKSVLQRIPDTISGVIITCEGLSPVPPLVYPNNILRVYVDINTSTKKVPQWICQVLIKMIVSA